MFSLLETLRLDDGRLVRLDRHLARLTASASHFRYPWRPAALRPALEAAAAEISGGKTATPDGITVPAGTWRTRILLAPEGGLIVEFHRFVPEAGRVWRVGLADEPVDGDDAALRHKTTERGRYHRARAARSDADDVLLWNARGEITEGTFTNVVADIDGVRITPPLACGLLPGVFRAELLEAGLVQEGVLTRADLPRVQHLWLVNSLREWIPASLMV
jgi:para-aminobenzoate synthetase/4-amino-4-deoxychorismate lyase